MTNERMALNPRSRWIAPWLAGLLLALTSHVASAQDRPATTIAGAVSVGKESPAGATVELCWNLAAPGLPPREGPPVQSRPGQPPLVVAADGAFSFEIIDPGARYLLRVQHPALALARLPADPAASPHTITLLRGVEVSGRVTAAAQPLANARVLLIDQDAFASDPYGFIERETRTGPDGGFLLSGVAPGIKTVRVEAAGRVPAGVSDLLLDARTARRPLSFDLASGRPLEGSVIRRGSGASIAGAWVEARLALAEDRSVPRRSSPTFVTRAGDDGRFRFDAVPNGQFDVTALIPGEGRSAAVNGEPDAGAVTITVNDSASISGRVVFQESGRVADFVQAKVLFFDGTPGGRIVGTPWVGRGAFAFRGLSRGRFVIAVRAPGRPPVDLGPVDIDEGQQKSDVEIALPLGARVRGAVFDASGAPIANARVAVVAPSAIPASGGVIPPKMPDAPARTGGDGRFDLTGLAPGTIQLEVTHDDYLPATTNAIDAPPGATVSDVRVVLRAGGTIRGIVRTAEGNPDGAAVIQASSGPIGSPLIRSAATDAQGRYAIRGLGAGSWTIRAQKREGQYAVSEEDRGLKPPRVVTITGEAVIDADF